MKAPRVFLAGGYFRTGTHILLTATIGFAAMSSMAAPRPRFDVTDLGTLPGGYQTFPAKINRHGHVVGRTHTADGVMVPFIYRDSVMTAITGISGQGGALDINDSGAVVGYGSRAFLYKDGIITDLNSIVGNDYVVAAGINNSGHIVGWTGITNDIFPAFLLDDTGVHLLAMLPIPHSSQAYAINDIGQGVGDSSYFIDTGSGETRQLAVLFEGATITILGALPNGRYSAARALNQHGMAVGWSGTGPFNPNVISGTHAVIYQGRTVIDLGVLPGDRSSYAEDINSAGWVVGSSEDPDEVSRAFLYAGGHMYDLNDLIKHNSGWTLGAATGINDRGQIVGWGMRGGEQRGFLLTPRR